MPLSAIIARADVMNWVPGAHASSLLRAAQAEAYATEGGSDKDELR
jgi:hypothetical protein